MNNAQTIDVTPESRTERRRGWTGGLALVVLGLVFLGQSLGWPVPENWWALFILIPAVPAFVRAVRFMNAGWGLEALRALGSALLFVALAVALLLNLDWSRLWPLFLIWAGVSMLLPRRGDR